MSELGFNLETLLIHDHDLLPPTEPLDPMHLLGKGGQQQACRGIWKVKLVTKERQ